MKSLRVVAGDGYVVEMTLRDGVNDADVFWAVAKTCRTGGANFPEFPLRLFSNALEQSLVTARAEVWDRAFDGDNGVRWKVDLVKGLVYNMGRPDRVKAMPLAIVPRLDEAEMYDFSRVERCVETCNEV